MMGDQFHLIYVMFNPNFSILKNHKKKKKKKRLDEKMKRLN